MAAVKVIGLCGGIGSGKSTVARYLAVKHDFHQSSFAAKLKAICADVFAPLGVKDSHFFGSQADKAEPIEKLGGVTGRRILELVGTEGFRAAYADVWVRYWAATLEPGNYVVEDVRYPNEAQIIRELGGKIWRIEREEGPKEERTGHASDEEWRRIQPDAVIKAKWGDIGWLYAQADRALCR